MDNESKGKTTFIKVKITQDEEGHWYIIPNNLLAEFHSLLDMSRNNEEGAEEMFIDTFEIYRTGGDINNIQLYIKPNNSDN